MRLLPISLVALLAVTGVGVYVVANSSDTPSAPRTATGYAQQLAESGTPMRWDPCRPIHYVTNLDEAPYDGALADVQRAVAEVAKHSKLRFIYDGATRQPLRSSHSTSSSRAGTLEHAALLIGFATKNSSDVLDGSDGLLGETEIVGNDGANGASGADGADGDGAISTAVLVLNAVDPEVEPGYGRGLRWGQVILHEMGHAVGLDHVSNPGELMNPELSDNHQGFGPGDRKGLAAAGSGGCLFD